jgi:homoserine kinase
VSGASGARAVRVRVPATSANIGPGFDALGLALSLYNRFEAEEGDVLELSGCDEEYRNEDNLFVKAYKRALGELGLPFRGLRVRFEADVPVARGLGSSSTCIVGGLMAASAIHGDALPRSRLLDLAAELEGHPDNVAPALLGGFVAAVIEGEPGAESRSVRALRFPIGTELVFNALVPPFELETSKARAALPKTLPYKDAVFNLGHAALVAAAFASRDYDALSIACEDHLHQNYRAPLIPGFQEVVDAAREAGAIAVFLSGAGPTVMAISRADSGGFGQAIAPALASRPEGGWRFLPLLADDEGAVIEN